MSYLHINNLYKDQDILMFKECYALEKIHGRSAHVKYVAEQPLEFFAGGISQVNYEKLFDHEQLMASFQGLEGTNCTVYGEVYGGSTQKMSDVYGTQIRFVAFDVFINDVWLSVPQAEDVCRQLNIEFIPYERVSTDIEALNAQRDKPSVQAARIGMGTDKETEGVVLRPLIELTKNNGQRIICKHKKEKWRETATVREVDAGQLAVLENAGQIALEWVTPIRMEHVLDKIPGHSIKQMQVIIRAMLEDVQRESEGEVVWSPEVEKAITKTTVILYKQVCNA